jgi:hypothetical protein
MSTIRPKVVGLRLDPVAYENLRQQVLRRDGWRCQFCGAMSNLEVHHQQFRSHCGGDTERNLITLCTSCHSQAHGNSCQNAGLERKVGMLGDKRQGLTLFAGHNPQHRVAEDSTIRQKAGQKQAAYVVIR